MSLCVCVYVPQLRMRSCINLTMCLCVQKQGPDGPQFPLRHQLLQVIVRVLQYRMLLTGTLHSPHDVLL